MKEKIIIKKNPNGDSRTAPKDITIEQINAANLSHRNDVREVMQSLGEMLEIQGYRHDWTKTAYEQEFYDNFMDDLNNGVPFASNTWYQKHIKQEKHHPFAYCHEDITLLDIIETVVDWVCAGKTRSGEVRPLEFDENMMKKAVENTVKMIDDMTGVQ